MIIPIFPKEPISLSFISELKPPSEWQRPMKKVWITADQHQKRSGGTRRESVNEMRIK